MSMEELSKRVDTIHDDLKDHIKSHEKLEGLDTVVSILQKTVQDLDKSLRIMVVEMHEKFITKEDMNRFIDTLEALRDTVIKVDKATDKNTTSRLTWKEIGLGILLMLVGYLVNNGGL